MEQRHHEKELVARHRIEEEFHDDKAGQGGSDFYGFGALSMADDYLFSSLGDLHGKRLLEIGCGEGEATLKFAQAGASVVAIDISGNMVEVATNRAREFGFSDRISACRMSGEDLQFADGEFDLVYGHSILHHLNLEIAGPRVARVLKPGGRAAFLEPLEYNPVLNLFRRLTPHRRTPTERPIRWEDLETVARHFSSWDHEEFYLVSLASFVWYYGIRNKRLFTFTQDLLAGVDRQLFTLLPRLKKYAWVTVVRFIK